jgi:decaprenyl-phosphate phosphoribosyltransferase
VGANDVVESPELVRPARTPRSVGTALVRAARPRQWIKNVLVFLAPAAAGALGHPSDVGRASLAGVIFILASSGTYLINDANDIESDRAHPTKRYRPIASGEVSPRTAWLVGVLVILGAVTGAALLAGSDLALCIGSYVVLTTAYSTWLKRVPYLELAIVASGFVLRAVAGGIAVHVAISPWFLVVTSSGALLIATGKRTAELMLLEQEGRRHRAVIAHYDLASLGLLRIAESLVTSVAYGLWAFSQAARVDAPHLSGNDLLFQLSIAPFVAGLVILELALRRGEGGEPEELALHNHALQLAGLACVGLVVAGIYL